MSISDWSSDVCSSDLTLTPLLLNLSTEPSLVTVRGALRDTQDDTRSFAAKSPRPCSQFLVFPRSLLGVSPDQFHTSPLACQWPSVQLPTLAPLPVALCPQATSHDAAPLPATDARSLRPDARLTDWTRQDQKLLTRFRSEEHTS